jgi:hypothetical protein
MNFRQSRCFGRITRYAEKGFYGHAAAGTRKDKMLIWESSVVIGAIEVNGS